MNSKHIQREKIRIASLGQKNGEIKQLDFTNFLGIFKNFVYVSDLPVNKRTATLTFPFPDSGLNFPLIFLIICSCK